MVFNTLEDLIIALKEGVFENDEFLTTSQGIQNNDVSLAETLWAKVVENTTQGTQDPNGNVTADEIGRTYIRTDVSPKQVYISNAATNSDWILLNDEVNSGNGTEKNSGQIDLGNLTKNTSLSAEEFTYLFDNFASHTLKAKSIVTDSSGVGSLEITKGKSKLKGEDQAGTTYSEVSADRVNGVFAYATGVSDNAYLSINKQGQISLVATNSGGQDSISLQGGEIDVRNQNLKGLRNELAPTNLDWETDNRYIPDVGTIKKNLPGFIREYTTITTVHGAILSNTYVSESLTFANDVGKYITYEYSSNPSTDVYAKSYSIDVDTTGAKIGDYVVVDFKNNYTGAIILKDSVQDKLLSQNATYILSWDGTNITYTMLGKPKATEVRGVPQFDFSPGIYYVGTNIINLAPISSCIEGECVEIISASTSTINAVPDGSDFVDSSYYSHDGSVGQHAFINIVQHDLNNTHWKVGR